MTEERAFQVFTWFDPTSKLPEEVVLVADAEGIQICVDNEPVMQWAWAEIADFTGKQLRARAARCAADQCGLSTQSLRRR